MHRGVGSGSVGGTTEVEAAAQERLGFGLAPLPGEQTSEIQQNVGLAALILGMPPPGLQRLPEDLLGRSGVALHLRGVGLIRYLVFFVIDLPTRKVEIAGIAPIPDGLWMEQLARNLVDAFSGFLRRKRFLIHDRDPVHTGIPRCARERRHYLGARARRERLGGLLNQCYREAA